MRCLVLLAVVLSVGACAQDVAPNTAKREYAISDRTLGYSYAGGSFKPIANTPLGLMARRLERLGLRCRQQYRRNSRSSCRSRWPQARSARRAAGRARSDIG